MITTQLVQLLRERSRQAEELQPSVFRVYEKRRDKPYAILLFDCTESVTRDSFDIRRYQEDWIRQEFFRVSGSLQWNIYCYLLCSDDALAQIQEQARIRAIESDTAYARKLVRTIAEVKQEIWFGPARLDCESVRDAPQEISDKWEGLLARNRLEVVSSALGYSETVRRILSGEQGDDYSPTTPSGTGYGITSCQGIAELKLQGFRPQLHQREFVFGDCNLIFGVNGAGKTSLLEAIELWLCGRNLRNEDDRPRTNCVSVVQRGSSDWVTGPESQPATYRDRDLAWYGNYEARKNVLCRSFGRFNFFNSDAAARLELAPDEESADQSVAKMILGETGARLAEKMDKVLDLLQKEESSYSRLLSQVESATRAYKEALISLTEPGECQDRSFAEVNLCLKSLGLRREPINEDGSIVSVLHAIQAGADQLQMLIDSTPWLSTPSELRIRETLDGLRSNVKRVSALEVPLKELLGKEAELKKKAEDYEQRIRVLTRYLQYIQGDALCLADGHQRLADLRTQCQLLANAAQTLEHLDFSDIQGMDVPLQQALRDGESLHQRNSEETSRLHEIVRSLEIRDGYLASLLADVRAKAKEILEADSNARSCPVCGTSYHRDDLLLRIENAAAASTSRELEQARVVLAAAQSSDRASALILQGLQALKSIVLSLGHVNLSESSPVTVLVACARSLGSSLTATEAELAALQETYRTLNIKGFTEEELKGLEEQVSSACGNEPPWTPVMLTNTIARLRKELADTEQAEANGQRDVAALDAQRTEASKICKETGVPWTQLPSLIGQLELSLEAISHLGEVFTFGEEADLRKFLVQLKTAAEMLQNHLRIGEQNAKMAQLIEHNTIQLKQAQREVDDNKPILDRIRQAIDVIKDIHTHYNAAEYQRSVLDANRNDISEIFCHIHAPQEFERVIPSERGVSLMLERRKSKEHCGVSKISSGQRTALCLAIFLALNRRAVKAPPIVLLDDPVAHVDDLNVLSFLDFLRDLAISGQRQIFFATASSKVAGLFKKKFDFMSETEFRIHELRM